MSSRRQRTRTKSTKRGKPAAPERREIRADELRAVVERARSVMSTEDVELLGSVVDTLAWLTEELEHEGATIARLRKILFGSSSEKTRDVVPAAGAAGTEGGKTAGNDAGGDETGSGQAGGEGDAGEGARRKGHGRNGAGAYVGAEKVTVPLDSPAQGDRCPSCRKGKLYRKKPSVLVRVRAVSPLKATVYELERLRCNACGEVFTARSPPGVGEDKYDETAAAMIALLKYGCGLPFNRLDRLGADLGIPLPAATQWEVVERAAGAFEPVWAELVRSGADGEVVYIDDTKARVLSLGEQIRAELAAGTGDRTGVFTSGVVSTVGEREIVLFFTGRQHAGENIAKVLAQRSSDLAAPIQMSDATSRNTSPGDFETIVANCLTHGRRHFVDVVDSFPAEVTHVLESLRVVYRTDAEARHSGLSPDERLRHHQRHSGPVMRDLEKWLRAQLDERKVEPNSTLGDAIAYMQNHWEALTLFLRVPGAPLDNNICERALKRAIIHRKNSLFYKTENGAHVGDVFMSLIFTAERAHQNPFEYLVAVQRHRDDVDAHPERWMPWNWAETLAQQPARADPKP